METAQPTTSPIAAVQPTTGGKAITSFVLGLIAIVVGVLAGVPGVVLGLLAIRDVHRSQGRRKGKWLALAGILLSVLGTIVHLMLLSLMDGPLEWVTPWTTPIYRDGYNSRTRARVELSQMSQAMEDFYSRFHAYPPSNLQLGPISGIDAPSKQFILKSWPRISPSVTWGPMAGRLSGDQVLVWALGGMQSGQSGSGQCLGFSNDPTDPTRPGGSRIGPFYEYHPNRLRIVVGRSARVFSYLDPYWNDVPYLYFATAPTGNSYTAACSAVTNNEGVSSGPVMPYFDAQSPIHFLHPNSFQIICAGKDGVFGPGGLWTSATARTVYPPGSAGSDDQSNFHPRPLGEK
jgi:Domain of unknown function (DUF4190)